MNIIRLITITMCCFSITGLYLNSYCADIRPQDELPRDWNYDDIASQAGNAHGKVYVLAWRRASMDSKKLDTCLTYRINDKSGEYVLEHLYRYSDDIKSKWTLLMSHETGGVSNPLGIWRAHYKAFNHKPTNKEVYRAMEYESLNWSFKFEKGVKLIGCGLCENNWTEVVGEKPTVYFGQ